MASREATSFASKCVLVDEYITALCDPQEKNIEIYSRL
jgi:hypothetical protein